MRILIISPAFYPATYYGGPIYSTYELAKALKKTGVVIRVITTNANGKEKLDIKTGIFHKLENELPVKYYKSLDSRGTSLSMILNLKKEIKKSDIVYLVSIFSVPTPFTILISKLLKKPLIISPRGQLGKWCLEQGSSFKKLWLRLFIHPICHPESFDKLRTGPVEGQSINPPFHWHLTSEEEKKELLAIYPSVKTFAIPNGVSQALFSLNDKPKDKTFYNKYTGFDCSNKNVLVSHSRIHKKKGYDILISSMSKVQELVPNLFRDLVLFIAGEDFGEKTNLEKLIDKLGLKEKVFFTGHIEGEEKISFLHNADVFALPSHNENFGMVYAEALAAGTPIVASTNTPWQDIEKNNCGLWVENTPDKFAEAINEILNSDLVQMGKNGSKFIEENFSWVKIGTEFKKQIEEIIGAK